MSAYAMPESFFQTAPPCPSVKTNNPKDSTSCPSFPLSNSDCKIYSDTTTQSDKLDCDPSVCAGGELGVTVNSAKVDHARLIKAVSKKSTRSAQVKSAQPNVETTYVSSNDDDDADSYFCRKVTNIASQSAHSEKGSENNYEDAIQFELSISFNGRKYTATRALPRFVKLRNELIAEMEKAARRARRRTTSQNRQHHMTPRNKFDEIDHQDRSDSDTDVDSYSDESLEESPPCVTIPVLPIDQKDSTGTIFGSCGFTMLHATLKEYCPAMERWLRHVADLVPPYSSPSLTNFLWEPLGSEDAPSTNTYSGKHPIRRQGTLNSINEAADGEDDFDADAGNSSWSSEDM